MVSFDPAEVAECRRLAETWAPVLHALANPDRLLIGLWLAGPPALCVSFSASLA